MSKTAQLKRNGTFIYQSTHTHTHIHRVHTTELDRNCSDNPKDLRMTSSVWVYTSSCPLHNPQQPSIESRKKKSDVDATEKGQERMKEGTGRS